MDNPVVFNDRRFQVPRSKAVHASADWTHRLRYVWTASAFVFVIALIFGTI